MKRGLKELHMQNDDMAEQDNLARDLLYYHNLFKFAPVGYLVTDMNGIMQEANTAAVKLLHAIQENIIGKPLTHFITEEEHPRLQTLLDQLKRGEDIEWLETVLQIQNDDSPHVFLTITVIPDDQSQFDRLCWVLHNLEVKRSGPGLQIPDELFDKVFSTPGLTIAYMDKNLRLIRVNRAFADISGTSPESCIGKKLLELFPDPELEAISQKVLETGEPHFASARPFRFSNHPESDISFWDFTLLPVKDRAGQASEMILGMVDVTGRQRTAAKLAYQAHLFDHVNDAVIAVDENFVRTMWNRGAEAIYGWKAEEVLGKPGAEFLKTEVAGVETSEFFKILSETGQFQGEALQYRKDGQPVYVEIKVTALQNEAGQVTGYVSVNRDITKRKQVEEQLRQYITQTEALVELSHSLAEVESDYKKVLDTIATRISNLVGDACVVTLLSDDGQWLNPVAFHHPNPEVKALLSELLPSVPYAANEGLAGRVVQSGQPQLIASIPEEQARALIKPEYWPYLERFRIHSMLIVPLRAQGRAIGTLGVIRGEHRAAYTDKDLVLLQELADRAALAIMNARLFLAAHNELAERLRTEQALRKSEARFRTIFSESVLGIELIDLAGRILTSNPAFQEMLGYSEVELEQMSFTHFTDPADLQNNQALFKRLARGEINFYRLEKRYLHKEGPRLWGRQSVSLVRDEMGKPQYAVVIVENITEQKRMAAELAELQRRLLDSVEVERLQLAQKLHDDAIQDLYGVTFHLEGIRNSLNDEEGISQLESAQSVLRQVIQTLRMTYKELRPPALVAFGLDKAISAHAENFQIEHPELILHLDLIPDSQMLSERVSFTLFRIYQQAMSNVLKHATARRVDIRLKLDEEHMILEVQDDGSGFTIPNSWIELVRQGHYGLASASERAEGIGGRLNIISHLDQGTLVQTVIPRSMILLK